MSAEDCPDITVTLEPALPDVEVRLEPALPDIRVELAEVGLVGPPGPPGPPGAPGEMGDAAALEAHRISPTPHPAYDDIIDLELLFENGLL